MNTNTEKKFSCLQMKDEIQAQIYEETKDMTTEEILAYFKRPTDQPLFQRLRERQRQKHNN